MAKIPDPWQHPEIWETLILLGPQGRVTIPNATVDVRGGDPEEDYAPIPGEDGGERSFLGYRDAEIEVEAVADTKAEFDNLWAALALYRDRRDQAPRVLQAAHPNLQLHGVRNVYIIGVESQDFSRDTGFVLRITLREWQAKDRRRTKKTSKVGDGLAPGSPAGTGPVVQAARPARPVPSGPRRIGPAAPRG
ncbi:hypothetical protein [Meiothermus sp.]|uniref:hypothetical protein n=1 Tax=Meiothermus sp. TaxID=1955249 RepID=UPI00307E8AAF